MTPDQNSLDLIFDKARTHRYFEEAEIADDLLKAVYDQLKMAPTWSNCQPGRFVFVKSAAAKERLLPHVAEPNQRKVKEASATVIIAHDTLFYEYMPQLYPHGNAEKMFSENIAFAEKVAFQNGCLQGAYLIIAARALGLDCGPMGGFDNAGVDKEFFPDGRWKSNFLCNLGKGDQSKLHPRDGRFEFDEACRIL